MFDDHELGLTLSQNYPFGHSHANLESASKRPTDYLLIILAFIAVVSTLLAVGILSAYLLTTLVPLPWTDYIPGVETLPTERQFLAASGALLINTLIFLILFRSRLKRNQAYQFINGCPSCRQHDLIRVHRQQYQRIIAQGLKIPLRCYACRNCRWQGVLVYADSQEVSESPLPAVPMKEEMVTQEGRGTKVVESSAADTNSTLFVEPQAVAKTEREGTEIGGAVEKIDDDEQDEWSAKIEENTQPNQQPNQRQQEEVEPPQKEPLSPRSDSSVTFTDQNRIYSVTDTPVSDSVDEIEEPSEVEIEESIRLHDEKRTAEGDMVEEKKEYVRPLADPPLDSFAQGEETVVKAIVVAPFGLSLRSAPDSRADIIRSLPPHSVVEVLDLETTNSPVKWRQVRFEGQVGWAAAAFLRYLRS